jgi:hypothetical protein
MTSEGRPEGARPARRYAKGAIPAVLIFVLLVIAWGPPVWSGWHLGYTGATDNACETRLGLQWCGHREPEAQAGTSSSAPPPGSSWWNGGKREAEERAKREEAATAQHRRQEEAEQPKREREQAARSHREGLESEGKAP